MTTPEDLIITDIYELNKEAMGKCVYIIICRDTLLAASSKADLNWYLSSDDCPLIPILGDELLEMKIIHGYVLNPLELPYELPEKVKEKSIYMLMDANSEFEIYNYDTIEETTEWVEFNIEDQSIEIEDFALIVGEELTMSLHISSTGEQISPLIFKQGE